MVAATGILGGFIAVGLVTPVPRVLCVGTENHINWAAVGSLELLTRADRCKPHGALTFDLSFSFSLRSPLLSPSPSSHFFFIFISIFNGFCPGCSISVQFGSTGSGQ